ncbi:MAG: choice-of-anchor J domain-containing protein [Hyphomicrobiales bacterium]
MQRKFTLLLFTFILFAFNANAQNKDEGTRNESNVILYESFEEWPAKGWSTHKMQGGSGFVQGSGGAYDGGSYAYKFDEEAISDDWLISPKFTVPEDGHLSFYRRNKFVDLPTFENHDIYVIEGDDDPVTANYTLIKSLKSVKSKWTKVMIDLNDYAGKEIRIGFNYKGDFSSKWYIDSFKVFKMHDYDVELRNFSIPEYVFYGVRHTPSVELINYGKKTIQNITLTLTVGDETTTQKVLLSKNETKVFTFKAIAFTKDTEISITATHDKETATHDNSTSLSVKVLSPAKAYGYSIYSDKNAIPNGPVTFNVNKANKITPLENKSENGVISHSGTMVNNLWFADMSMFVNDRKGVPVVDQNSRTTYLKNYVLIDTETGKLLNIAPAEHLFAEMSYNRTDDKVYAINSNSENQELYTIDYRTGVATLVATANESQTTLVTLAIDRLGAAYGIGMDSYFYKINLEDFTLTKIGNTGLLIQSYSQSMEFDHVNSTLYFNLCNDNDGNLYVIDVKTGKAHYLETLDSFAEITAFGFSSGEKMNYTALKITDQSDNILRSVEAVADNRKIVTDETGIATFLGYKDSQTIPYTLTHSGVELHTGEFTTGTNQILEVKISPEDVLNISLLGMLGTPIGFSGEDYKAGVVVENNGLNELKNIQLNITAGDYKGTKTINVALNERKLIELDAFPLPEDGHIEVTATLENDKNKEDNSTELNVKVLKPIKAYAYSNTSDGNAIPPGPVTYNVNTPDKITPMQNASQNGIMARAGTMIHNYWFASTVKVKDKKITPYSYAMIDIETGKLYHIAECKHDFLEMAYDYKNSKLYAIKRVESRNELYTIDYHTGEATLVGKTPEGISTIFAFAIDLEGNAYGIDFKKYVYKIDLNNFNLALVGSTGTSNVRYAQSMAFDHDNGNLYWNQANNTEGIFHYVDVETGKAEEIGILKGNSENTCLGFPYGEEKLFAALEVYDGKNYVKGVKISFNGKEKTTDENGIVLFLDLEKKEYEYSFKIGEDEYTGTINVEKSQAHRIVTKPDGVKNLNVDNIRVYPNPTKGRLNIDLPQQADYMKIIDITGKTVYNKSGISKQEVINCDHLLDGIYQVVININGEILKEKVIIIK